MAADVNTGMEKPDMKRLLAKSKTEPVNCAFGQGDDNTVALLMLDKVKGPKSVEKELTGKFPSAKNTRFGTATVDMDIDPKEVRFAINKPVSGIARKLVKTLKGTGYTKIVIVLEDGTAVESYAEDDDAVAAAPAAPPAPPPPLQPDAALLTRMLAELIKRIPPVVLAAPALKEPLGKLAGEANASIKSGALADAGTRIAALRKLLDSAPLPAAPAPAPAPAPARADGAKVAYAKSRLAWLAARGKMESEIEKLRQEIVATYQEDGSAPELDKLYRERVAPVLSTLDERLADTLDAAANATDPAQHTKLVAEARGLIGEYTNFLDGEPLIADLDDNPFVPLSIKATLSGTLAALSKAVV